jgi:thiol-disulfide isomerase/thioredoxin
MAEEVSYPVELYVYDLSGGLARQLSASLLGRQIDAVYHTSIVIKYRTPREFFFGQGISVTSPGGSHHGRPMEIVPLGSTSIDEETWNEILQDLRTRYTPAAYNLMTNNCNNFSDEVANILVGRSIPAHITSLPSDFQNAMGAMAARRGNGPMAGPAGPSPLLGLMDQFNQRAQGGTYGQQNAAPAPLASTSTSGPPPPANLIDITSAQQLNETLQRWSCAAVLFTNTKTCPPCKMLHPRFVDMARAYAAPANAAKKKHKHIAFVVVDSSPATQTLMASNGIRGTPTLKFYVKGKERHSFSGADVAELRSQVDLTLFEVWVAHPHTQLKPPLTSMKHIPKEYIISSSIPNFTSAVRVLDEAVSALKTSDFKAKADVQDCRKVIVKRVVPWLEARFAANGDTKKVLTQEVANAWKVASRILMEQLPETSVFPLVDMLRVATIDDTALLTLGEVPKTTIAKASKILDAAKEGSLNRPLWLTTLRLAGNIMSNPFSLGTPDDFEPCISLIFSGMLQEDKAIRNAASSAAFNVCLLKTKGRVDFIGRDVGARTSDEEAPSLGEDFDTQALSALVHAIQNEHESVETLHRLLACVFQLQYLSEQYEEHEELLEVLDLATILKEKEQMELLKGTAKEEEIRTLLKDCAKLLKA